MKEPQSQRGFSLIELLIVVAVIGIIAAIAITYILQAKQAAKGASAISSMRVIHSSQTAFRAANGRFGNLTELGNANLVTNTDLVAGRKSGYDFVITPDASDPSQDYVGRATPLDDPNNEWQHYFVDATGVLRFAVGAPANTSSPPIN
ncbi:MAG TPA: prepilin-type N-terminal cleavage/methylation domain-containing protein [Pyrinomonadaceae bacterium]